MFFSILKVTLTIVEVVVCCLLITAILIQKSKTQGAGLAFGAGVGETLFGGQIGNVMTKVTVILAVVFLVNTTALGYLAVKTKYRRAVPVKKQAAPRPGGRQAQPAPEMPPMAPPDTAPEGASVPVVPPAPAE